MWQLLIPCMVFSLWFMAYTTSKGGSVKIAPFNLILGVVLYSFILVTGHLVWSFMA